MQWAVFVLVLSATVSSISSQKCPYEVESPLVFPDGTLPDLVPKRCRYNNPTIKQPRTLVACEGSSGVAQRAGEADDPWRLNRDVIPSHYDLKLDVYVDTFKFTGEVEITVTAMKSTRYITLHSDGLLITETSDIFRNHWWWGSLNWGSIVSVTHDEERLTVTLHINKPLEAGQSYTFKIGYSGEIREDLLGFYRSSYKVGDETRWLATTQFEPTHARRAFPCFDEPNLKAWFDISITHDKKYTALSNMPIEKTESKGERQTDKFKTTPRMSTYLIAFIISDFQKYEISVRISSVYASEDFIKDVWYSQKKGVEAVFAMERFTGIIYNLPKIDHVGIPDFDAGAMANWGLITYRDYLLIKRNDTNSPTKQYIPRVISNEIAHQWFGNLVTLDWWSYTWLNEGFATFFEYYITDIIEDKFAMWDQFIPSKFQVALELDGNPATSHAMSKHVSTPEDIRGKFDQISYGKGGCILRMISELLTHDKFQQGLRNYLNKKQFANAKPEDLFVEWANVSSEASLPEGIDFTKFAKSWTEQGGVPVVTAIRNYETGEVTFTQQRHYDTKPDCPNDDDRRWWIPLTWISSKESSNANKFKPEAWLRGNIPDEKVVKKTDLEAHDWLLLNPRSVGYYRVNYDTKNWLLLSSYLTAKPMLFPTQNRAQIINDAFILASSNQLDFAVALGTLSFLPNERYTSVWMSASRIISRLADEMGPTEAYPLLEDFGKKILSDVYFTVRLKPLWNEQHLTSLLRYYVGPWACIFGVEQCIKDATENLNNFMQDPNSVHPDVVTATLCGAVKGANEEAFWKIRENVAHVARAADQKLIVAALGKCQSDNKLVKQHLEDVLKEDSKFPKDLKLQAITQVLAAPSKFSVGFDFIKENIDKLVKGFGQEETTSLVIVLISRLRTETHYDQLAEWVKDNSNKLVHPESVAAVLTLAKESTKWNTFHLSDVTDWLATNLGRDPPCGIPEPPPPDQTPGQPNSTTPTGTGNAAFVKATPFMTATASLLTFIFTN